MNEIAVSVTQLSRRFGSFTAVDNISLEVARGETFGFLGANGAGKTTTIRMLCGLLTPTSGAGTVGDKDIMSQSEEIKRIIGYMSQKFSLYADLTGRENLEFYAAAYGLSPTKARSRLESLTEELQLEQFLDRLTASLPTGWRQRLALGAALLHEPAILFLDEPTSGVDPMFRRKFWRVLYKLADRGKTVFVTTHYMDEAEYCDRISIMHQGRMVAIGRPPDVAAEHGERNLEDAFIRLISDQGRANEEN